MRSLSFKAWVALAAILLTVPAIRAQQPAQDNQSAPPIPALRSPLASMVDNGDQEDETPQTVAPDNRPLAGVQNPTTGILLTSHSFWQTHVDALTTFDTYPLKTPNQSGWIIWNSALGGIDLHRNTLDSNLVFSLLGGGAIANNGSSEYGIPDASVDYSKLFRRWTLSVLDQMSYVPEAAFGFSGLGGVLVGGSNPLELQGNPGDILTPSGQRVANNFILQADIPLSSRSSVTFAGGYSLLRSFSNSIFDVDGPVFQAGYNYRLSPKNSMAVLYRFEQYGFRNLSPSLTYHSAQMAFGRIITGRLAFRIAGGAGITSYSSQGTSSGGGNPPIAAVSVINWALSSSLRYNLQRTKVGFQYDHGLSGGSGVLQGAINDRASVTVDHQLTRMVGATIVGGYTRDEGLVPTGTARLFNGWFGQAGLSRTIGRSLSVSGRYEGEFQASNVPYCIGTSCQKDTLRNEISLVLSWHTAPMRF